VSFLDAPQCARVLLDRPELPDAAAIADSLSRRHPGLRAEPTPPSRNLIEPGSDVQTLRVGAQAVIVSLIRRPARTSSLAWTYALPIWPDILDAASFHQAHLLVSTMGPQPAEPLTRARTITATIGSILDLLPSASTVVWISAVARPAAIWRQDSLASFAPSPEFPFLLWVNILPIQTTEGIVVSSDGLTTFHKSDIRVPKAQRHDLRLFGGLHITSWMQSRETIQNQTSSRETMKWYGSAMTYPNASML